MRKLILKTDISLDGFMEGPNGAMDWFPTDDKGEWAEIFAILANVDAVLLGRVMYPGYAEFWRGVLAEPYKHSKEKLEYAKWADKTRHIVFSRTMKNADWPNTEIMRDAGEDVPRLKRENGKNLIVYGGAIFAGGLIERELVDEFHLDVQPVALGGGKRLFQDLGHRLRLKRTRVKALPQGGDWLSFERGA